MFEKVNPQHPDKVADRIAGAVVDLAYTKADNPKIAVEVLLGHGECTVMIEASVMIWDTEVEDIVHRIAGNAILVHTKLTSQDVHLANNQQGAVRCGDNGIFKGCAPTHEQKLLTAIAASIYDKYPHDGKYLINEYAPSPSISMLSEEEQADIKAIRERHYAIFEELDEIEENSDHFQKFSGNQGERFDKLVIEDTNLAKKLKDYCRKSEKIAEKIRETDITVCQSHLPDSECGEMLEMLHNDYGINNVSINPLGDWTGGPDVDTGATNRKLGSDMGDSVTGGGLMGKDLSKADVSVNIACFLRAQQSGQTVTACCAIGDKDVTFVYHEDGKTVTQSFSEIVEQARLYILTIGGFEAFACWGLIRPDNEKAFAEGCE